MTLNTVIDNILMDVFEECNETRQGVASSMLYDESARRIVSKMGTPAWKADAYELAFAIARTSAQSRWHFLTKKGRDTAVAIAHGRKVTNADLNLPFSTGPAQWNVALIDLAEGEAEEYLNHTKRMVKDAKAAKADAEDLLNYIRSNGGSLV